MNHEWVVAIAAGLVGGVLRGLFGGLLAMPRMVMDPEGRRVLDPGFVGAILVSGGAGFGAWALTTDASFADVQIDVKPISGAFIAGFGGGQILAGFVNQQYLQATNGQLTSALGTMTQLVGAQGDTVPSRGGVTASSTPEESQG